MVANVRLTEGPRGSTPRQAGMRPWTWFAILVLYLLLAWATALRGEPRASTGGFRLDEQLAQAHVTVKRGALETPCPWQAGDRLFKCADDAYAFVGPYAGYAAGRALQCTWLHPLPGGATTIVRWPDVPLGDRVEARLALLDDVGPGADVRVTVRMAGKDVASLHTAEARLPGEVAIDVPPGPGHGGLQLELTATDHAWRLACLEFLMTGRREQGMASHERELRPEPMLPILPQRGQP